LGADGVVADEVGGVGAEALGFEFGGEGFEVDGATAVGIAEDESDALAKGALGGAIFGEGLDVNAVPLSDQRRNVSSIFAWS
jgi:hypothetical protein